MKKQYLKVQELLNLSALESDKENGCYFVESMMDDLEEKAAEYKQNRLTLDAKLAEIQKLNANIEEMRSAHAAEVARLNEEHAQEIQNLKVQEEDAKSAHAEAISSLQEEIQNLKAENEELAKAGAAQPAPKENSNGETTEATVTGAHSVVKPGMTPEEMAAAIKEREEKLRGQ